MKMTLADLIKWMADHSLSTLRVRKVEADQEQLFRTGKGRAPVICLHLQNGKGRAVERAVAVEALEDVVGFCIEGMTQSLEAE